MKLRTEGQHRFGGDAKPRHQLTDDEWEQIQGLFPTPSITGRLLRSRRQIVDDILWILRTGAPLA